ncbi:MAG: hypothetical protein JW995_12200 [Melioribacteraceae bacterium]|nr:hypothetical protein [Melioribacteraceae bacterium]
MNPINFYRLSVIILIIGLFAACSDEEPLASEEEHFEAIGTLIYNESGDQVVSILRGITDDTLKVNAGVLSGEYSLKFYNEDEEIVDPPADEHITLGYELGNTGIVNWHQNEGGFTFQLEGLQRGNTTLELFILHEGHNDYRSGVIPVEVK